jgi:hypothetical protein
VVAKLVEKIRGTANSPAAALYAEETLSEDEVKMLDMMLDDESAGEYRSVTAVALYLSKRTRLDLLLAVNR